MQKSTAARASGSSITFLVLPVLGLTLGLSLSAGAHQVAIPTETPEEWITLAKRVHGGFGSYLPLGIRIGLDARERLHAGARELDVTYFDGPNAPCPCVADGLMLATGATLGQGTLRLAPTQSAPTTFGVAVIKNKTTGKAWRYTIPAAARASLDWLNAHTGERERFDRVMAMPAKNLFEVQSVAFPLTASQRLRHGHQMDRHKMEGQMATKP